MSSEGVPKGVAVLGQEETPIILFVHGSWHSVEPYQKQIDLFKKHGYPVQCPLLPSFAAHPNIGLIEDAQRIREALEDLVHIQKKYVLVVAHSYGGVVATEAVDAKFGVKFVQEHALKGGVLGIFYVAAFVLPVGQSLGSALGGGPPPDTKLPPFIPVDDKGMCTMVNPETQFYSDLPPEEQKHWVSLLRPCPAITQLQTISYAAYLHHPVTYLVCEQDTIPQRQMIAGVESLNKGLKFKIETCDAGHSPFLSMPNVLVECVDRMMSRLAPR